MKLRILIAISVTVALAFISLLAVGSLLVAPNQHIMENPPGDLAAESLVIQQQGGPDIAAWFASNPSPKAGVLLLHNAHAVGHRETTALTGFELWIGHGFSIRHCHWLGHILSISVPLMVVKLNRRGVQDNYVAWGA